MGKLRDPVEDQVLSDRCLSDEFAQRYFAGERFVDWRSIVAEVEEKSQELVSQRKLLQSADSEQTAQSQKEKISALIVEIKGLEDDVRNARGFVRSAEGALAFAMAEGERHGNLFESIRCRTIAMLAQNIVDSAAPILALEKAQRAVILPSPRDTAACEATHLTCRRKSFLERRKKNDTQSSQDQSYANDGASGQKTAMDPRRTSPLEMGTTFGNENGPGATSDLSWSSIAAMFNPVSDLLCSPFAVSDLENKFNESEQQISDGEQRKIEIDHLEKQEAVRCDTFENSKTVESFEAELPACTLPKHKVALTHWHPDFDEPEWPEQSRLGKQHQRKLSDFSWGEFEEGAGGAEKKTKSQNQQSDDDELGFIDEPFAMNEGLGSRDPSDDYPYERNNASTARDDTLGHSKENSYTVRDHTSYSGSVHSTLHSEVEAEMRVHPFHKSQGNHNQQQAILASKQSFQQTFHSAPFSSGSSEISRFEEYGEI